MKRIATLGPPQTFSDLATSQYIADQNDDYEVEYFPSIGSALKAIGSSCEAGVLPVENFSEGFIPLVLDQLVKNDLTIIGEVILPIQFSFISTLSDRSKIKQLFVQFVARGQCSRFLESLGEIEIVTTESNIESLDRARCTAGESAAIVPSQSFGSDDFPLVVENVNDYENNRTRFLVFAGGNEIVESNGGNEYKTSIIALDDKDHPGLLGDILGSFSKRKINLISIISRPSCTELGKYHFFIDFDGHIQDPLVSDALGEIRKLNRVKILGSYPKGEVSL
jgi:prephenate dehydratase